MAFANGVGGRIIIGVEDGTKKVVGVTDQDRDRLYEDFPNCLYESVKPTLVARIYEKVLDSVSVLIVEIPPSPKKPYFVTKKGMPGGVYVRIGASSRTANQDHIEELIRAGNRKYYDEEALDLPEEVLSKRLLKDHYGKQLSTRRLLSDTVIQHSSTNPEQYNPTVTGILHFSEEPHRLIPEACILVTRFKGTEGRDIVRTQELTGPLGALSEETLTLIRSWIQQDYQLQGMRLIAELPIPEVALREAITNALLHRKYTIAGAIKIAIYSNRIEVFSPGTFPGLIDIDNIGDGTTYLRNPHLMRLARHLGLVEKLGTGVRLIFRSCEEAGLPLPKYFEGGDFVKVTFEFERRRQPSQSDQEAILQLVDDRGRVAVSEVRAFLGTSRNTASRKLGELVKAGELVRTGKGPAVRYTRKHP